MPETHYFSDLLHSSQPSDTALFRLYGLESLKATTRLSFPGWTDASNLPPTSWYDAAAAGLNPTHGWVAIDHENWTGENQADRLATSAKFATFYSEMKSRRPDLKFGFYAYGIRVHFTNPAYPTDDSRYIAWQRENEDYAEMNAVVDALFPTLYCWFDVATDGLSFMQFRFPKLFQAYLLECRRMLDTYGRKDRPIFPYIWWRKHDDSAELDAWVWEGMLQSCQQYANGCVLWGGYRRVWDDRATWWTMFLSYYWNRMQRSGTKVVRASTTAGFI